jgi:poly-gamma-glutamate capsule biosynthesis protein CapA/YwtB (metallophosphatase superfamily)
LRETLTTLQQASLTYVGAGLNDQTAAAPAVFPLSGGKGRVLVFAGGHCSSGVLDDWKARSDREGLNIIDVDDLAVAVPKLKQLIGLSVLLIL